MPMLSSSAPQWEKEVEKLRSIILGCHLKEEIKWGKPCFTFQKKNVVLIMRLKEHCVLLFFKGALLKDADRALVKPGENSQAGRFWRFASLREINDRKSTIGAYVREAVELEKAGAKVDLKKPADLVLPDELEARFKKDACFKAAFGRLTPGRQRAYVMHFAQAKQKQTRESRIEKCMPRIFDGKGLND